MTLATKYLPNYTIEDYQRWEGDWELIEGVPFAMSPSPTAPHQWIEQKLLIQMSPALNACQDCFPWHELDWLANEHNVFRPDVMISCEGMVSDYVREVPKIIFEIASEGTADKDRNLKFRQYEAFGVQWHVILDPKSKSAEIYWHSGKKYQEEEIKEGQYEFEISEDCKLVVDFNSIWPA